MKKFHYLLAITLCALSGCISTQHVEKMFLPRISEEEAFAVANEYLANSKSKPSPIENELEVWTQPSNKSISCKVCVVTQKDNNITNSIGYKIYWDGACKNGYAYGLGREVVKSSTEYFDNISLYSGKKERPTEFSSKNFSQNSYRTYGLIDSKDENIFSSGISDEGNDNININYLKQNKKNGSTLIIKKNLIKNSIIIIKDDKNGFVYRISTYPFNKNGVFKSFDMFDTESLNIVGFISLQFMDKSWRHFRVENGNLGKEVKLPESRLKLITDIEHEADVVFRKSSNVEKFSKHITERYQQMIKDGEVKNNFMNKKDYMSIFEERKQLEKLNNIITEKINSINDATQRERIIRAREQEAIAAQRRAEAAETTSFQNNLNQITTNHELQNIGQQLQFMRMGL